MTEITWFKTTPFDTNGVYLQLDWVYKLLHSTNAGQHHQNPPHKTK